ncbi:MAG: hypothetical protein R3B35_00275 [Gemmatimonadales bacterium]
MNLLFLVAFAILFHRAADYERMNPWLWSIASLGLSGVAILSRWHVAAYFASQGAIFGAMWWHNLRRQRERGRR